VGLRWAEKQLAGSRANEEADKEANEAVNEAANGKVYRS